MVMQKLCQDINLAHPVIPVPRVIPAPTVIPAKAGVGEIVIPAKAGISSGLAPTQTRSRIIFSSNKNSTKKSGMTHMVCMFLMIVFFPLLTLASSLTTQLDRTQIADGESVNLIIKVNGKNAQQPELSPLDKDFAVISSSTRSSMQIINGESTSSTTWIIGLIPKTMGELTIPKLKVGNDFTQSLTLTVNPQAKKTAANSDMFVEVEIEPQEAYVQQQLVYKLRLNAARSFMNVHFVPPQSDDATIEQLGHDVRYMSTVGGKAFQVVEKHFLIFPQKSGTLTLAAPVFTGEVVDEVASGPGVSSFVRGFSGFGRSVKLKGDQLAINIKPKPENFSGQWWLPAENLRIEESFSKEIKDWKMGEPLTRTIKITAKGLLAEQLPDLQFSDNEYVNIYPDKPIIKNEIVDGKLLGQKEFRIAMMPKQNGEVSLPAYKVIWWDVNKNKEQVATLPSRTFSIIGEKVETPKQTVVQAQDADKQPVEKEVKESNENTMLWIVVGFLMLSGWLFSFWLWYRTKKPSQPKVKVDLKKPTDTKSAIKFLLDWAKKRWPDNPPVTLLEIARRLYNSEFEKQISLLEKAQYSNSTTESWDSDEFWVIFQKASKQKSASAPPSKEPVPDLY